MRACILACLESKTQVFTQGQLSACVVASQMGSRLGAVSVRDRYDGFQLMDLSRWS